MLERHHQRASSVREWLRPGGELHIADWGNAQNVLVRVAFFGVQLLDGFGTTTETSAVGSFWSCVGQAFAPQKRHIGLAE
jgi:hypothetical protein